MSTRAWWQEIDEALRVERVLSGSSFGLEHAYTTWGSHKFLVQPARGFKNVKF